jgi:predicted transcriptional regulator
MARDTSDTHRNEVRGGDESSVDDGVAAEGDGRTTAIEGVDQRIVDLLSWILDTETRAKIYVYLLANPGSTSEEVAKGTGLYPSTVREAVAELHEEERVSREKRASEGAGNNPYEYTAIQPSELVGGVVDQVQHELNTIFTLDRVLDRHSEDGSELEAGIEPVTITVDETTPSTGDDDGGENGRRDEDGDDSLESETDAEVETADVEADRTDDTDADD